MSVSPMRRARFLSYEDQRILYVDYTDIRSAEELEKAARKATQLVRAEPPNSVLMLLNFTGVPFGLRIIRILGEAAAANAEFVRARAIIGIPESARSTVGAVAEYSGRPLELFREEGAAMEWLAGHADA